MLETWDNLLVCKNPTGSDRKWPKMTPFLFYMFWKKIFEIFFWKLILKFFSLFFYKCPIFSPIWVVFWYIQGAEVELVLVNSTSSPCTYQKNVSGVSRMKYWYSIFLKSKKNMTKQKFKISQKLNFYKRGHFWSFPVTSGPVFLHQKIVSSL